MLVLNTTTKVIRIKLAEAGAVPYVVNWIDINATIFTCGSLDGYSNGTTGVTMITAPGSGLSRRIKEITVYNNTAGDINPTIYENNNGAVYNLLTTTLKTLEMLQYTDGKGWKIIDSNGWIKVGGDAVKYNWKRTGWINYVSTKMLPHCTRQGAKGGGSIVVNRFAHGMTVSDGDYFGGVLAPNDNIYLIPASRNSTTWHYINTKTKAWGTYTGYASATANKYWGGVLDKNGIIWPVPYGQSSSENYHYIDTNTNTVTEFAHGLGSDTPKNGAYVGGVLTPDGSRIYLIPVNWNVGAKWHYIDTATKTYVAYAHGLATEDLPLANGYYGGCLGVDGKIYFIPATQAYELKWHYIDTDTNTVVAYANGLNHAAGREGQYEYLCGAMAQNGRIYFAPFSRTSQTTWAYIDSNDGTCHTYEHGLGAITGGYVGGNLAFDGKIYFSPLSQAAETTWHYIDTNTNTAGSYTPTYTTSTNGFMHGITDRWGNVWPIVRAASTTYSYYISYSAKGWWPMPICTSPLFNKA